MTRSTTGRMIGALGALAASTAFLGAGSNISTSMYLRVPSMSAAPPVQGLSYDAIATVPARPHTPAALLPEDRVTGAIILPVDTTLPALRANDFRGVSGFTVVQTADDGSVVRRTRFQGISITSIELVGGHDGNLVRRIKFDADSVNVTPR